MRRYALNGEAVSLRAFLADNELAPEDVGAIRAMSPGESFVGGGGAAPEWTLRCEAKGRKLPSPPITDRPEWGLIPEGPYCAMWGARAIHERHAGSWDEPRLLSLLWDRQGAKGPKHELDALQRWINGKATGLAAMRKELHKQGIEPSDSRRVTLWGGPRKRFAIAADPRSSFGYVYLAAWVVAEPIEATDG